MPTLFRSDGAIAEFRCGCPQAGNLEKWAVCEKRFEFSTCGQPSEWYPAATVTLMGRLKKSKEVTQVEAYVSSNEGHEEKDVSDMVKKGYSKRGLHCSE